MPVSSPSRMARSAADATRFTATTPHAYSKGNASTVTLPGSQPPANETPQQKVARLREAARRSRLAQESNTDRLLSLGRRWADRAHKVTVTGLVGLSVLSVGVAAWSLGGMVLYNRRKRREWYTEQQMNYEIALGKAREAQAAGKLTPDLLLVLNKENAILQAEEEQRNRKGAFTRAKEWAFGGLAKEEKPSGRATAFSGEEIKRIAEGRPLADAAQAQVQAAARNAPQDPAVKRAADGLTVQTLGGPLDQMAQNSADAASHLTRSWYNWLRRT